MGSLSKLFVLIAALFPYVLLFLALLEFARGMNIGNNLYLLSLPYSALSMPLAILLLSSAFKDIPKELEEASVIEGLSRFQIIKYVLLPLIKPALSSTSILVFIFSWNEYPIALTWLSNQDSITLPVAIARLAGSSLYSVPYGAFAAATVLGSIPLLIIVMIFQSQIVNGLTQGAVKG
ncbi:carbohydrate ABC transporter permease [Prochlorococcus sp. MIT 1341]|uniref:carbohydrate ABC transporter permease n=1 Tax=Prochlorococcus sp. MIT 1341 TaxID=3096221 RepID=UPI0039BF720D